MNNQIVNVDVISSNAMKELIIDDIWYGNKNISFGSDIDLYIPPNSITLASYKDYSSETKNSELTNFFNRFNGDLFLVDDEDNKINLTIIISFYEQYDVVLGPMAGLIVKDESNSIIKDKKYKVVFNEKNEYKLSFKDGLYFVKDE